MRDTVQNYSISTFSWDSPIIFFVWGLPYNSNRHVTPVSVQGHKGLTCSIRAPPRPRFDTLQQSVSTQAQLFLAVYGSGANCTALYTLPWLEHLWSAVNHIHSLFPPLPLHILPLIQCTCTLHGRNTTQKANTYTCT